MHFNAQSSMISKNAGTAGGAHETSIVSHEMFYSPILQANDGNRSDENDSDGGGEGSAGGGAQQDM